MARNFMHHRTRPIPCSATLVVATLFVQQALAQEPAKEPTAKDPTAKEPTVTLTFPALTRARAKLKVNADDPGGPPATFKIHVGSAAQTFTRATPAASRTIEVPADPRVFLRFGVEKAGAPRFHGLALITPDSRPLLVPDACATWDLATNGGVASDICVAKDRHCPTASRPSPDRTLTQTWCGTHKVKYCIPDYRVDVAGANRQKVRVGVDGEHLGNWIQLRGPNKIRHLRLPSGGPCPGITVESSNERVRISLGWGQGVLVRVSETGQISAEDLPPPAHAPGGGD